MTKKVIKYVILICYIMLFVGIPVTSAPQKDLLKEFYDNLAANTGMLETLSRWHHSTWLFT